MRKNLIGGIAALGMLAIGCSEVKRKPGRAYMPDMSYSVAVETYASTDNLKQKDIFYNATPVPGTIARGDLLSYSIPNDSAGYIQSAIVKNPIEPLDATSMTEAERLYLVNCAICHGTKLDGNGPLWNDNKGPYPAAPKSLVGDEIKGKADGTLYHVMTYGKGLMGSYAAQINSNQRWMIVQYIRKVQGGTGGAKTDSTSAVKKDSIVVVK